MPSSSSCSSCCLPHECLPDHGVQHGMMRKDEKDAGRRTGGGENEEEDAKGRCRTSLCDIGDDALSAVLSFLSPADIVTCSSVCRHLRDFCKDDKRVWLPMCERRWGGQTCVQQWGRRKVAFKVLRSLLSKLENLVGFWRGVGHGGHGSLVVFEWGPYFMSGFRVTPFRPSSYGVCKVPFVWIGVSDVAKPVCFFDPSQTVKPFVEDSSSNFKPSSSTQGSPGQQQKQPTTTTPEGRRRDPFAGLLPDADLEQQCPPPGLVVVDLHFVGNFHIVMEELQQPQFVGNRSLAEAAVAASFGSSGNLAGAAAATSPDCERYGQSPPGSFQHEMYQFLASKVTSQGGDRSASRKQRRREKERAFIQGRRTCEPEHFVKVRDVGPTPARPLQGLWKGLCDSLGLDFLLLLYDDRGGIVCRRVGECLGTTHNGSVCWTAKSDSTVRAPLPELEQEMFNVRQHIWPRFYADVIGQQGITRKFDDEFDEEVVGMLCTNPIMGLDFGRFPEVENIEGRVWQYASGRFGFGFLPQNFIIDFRPICSPSGLLWDVLD